MTMKQMPTAEERREYIVTALAKTYLTGREEAQALLDRHIAEGLRLVDEELGALENPYRLGRSRRKWTEGVLAARARVYMTELRLRTSADRHTRRRTRDDMVACARELPPG